MKSVRLLVVLALAVFMATFATTAFAAPLPNGTLLTITPGVGSSGTTPCSVGSCFSMYNGGLTWTDFGPGTDGGIVIGKDQITGGQEYDGSITDPGEMTSSWFFFNSIGCFGTAPICAPDTATVGCATTNSSSNVFSMTSCTSAADCLGKTTLGTWNIGWNGVAVPMGSAPGCQSITPSNCAGVTSWTLNTSPATCNSTYELRYNWAVPDRDPSGFGNVPFALILRGTVSGLPVDTCDSVTCAPATACKSAGFCTCTGLCEYTNKADGTACMINGQSGTCTAGACNVTCICPDDGNPCTNDICQSGVCQHIAVANGTLCNADNNFCTGTVNNILVNDTCTNGVCVAGPLKVCSGTNTCKDYGVCNPATGLCLTPMNKPVGTPCNDNNACTLNDACVAGAFCKGTANFCRDSDVCTLDVCTAGTGVCTHDPMGTPGWCGSACPNPIPTDTKLLIARGSGSGLNIPCSTGSCFSMLNGTDVMWTDIAPGTDGGFWIGHSQASGGQENVGGGEITTAGALTASWGFFNEYGTFFTMPDGDAKNIFCGTPCQGPDCLNKTELKVFNIAWNGGVIPMGSEAGCVLSNCTDLQKNGVNVNDWQIDPLTGVWSMDYAQVIPTGSFMNVKFQLILRGTKYLSDGCFINGTGYNNGVLNPANPCQVCDMAQSTTAWSNNANGTTCDDGNLCNGVSTCQTGVCTQTIPPVTCPAPTACITVGACVPSTGVCPVSNKSNGTPCPDDNNSCTADSCDAGVCVHTYIPGCGGDPLCVGQPNGTPCSDGNLCNGIETCQSGICTAGVPVVCPAPTACATVSACVPSTGVCPVTPKSNGTACDDGNACTIGDYCQGGACTGVPIVCVPPDNCHLGACDTATGICSFPLAPACSVPVKTYTLRINSAASIVHTTGGLSGWGEGDLSLAGTFQAVVSNGVVTFSNVNITATPPDPFAYWIVPGYTGTAIQAGTGYTLSGSKVYNNSTGGGNFSGTISGTTFSMSGSFNAPCCDFYNYQFFLNGTAEIVDPCATMNCNDNNPCTIDSCNSATGSCVHRPVQCVTGSSCDPATCSCVGCIEVCYTCTSDLDCSGNGRCVQGTCSYTSSFCKGDACNNATCDPASGCILTPISCDDNNVCTTDTCNPATGCVHTPLSGGTCNDGNACTVGDSCQSGVCTPGTPSNCNDNNACTTDSCNPATGCVHGVAVQCPLDFPCDPADGLCKPMPCVPADCNDNNPCTIDTCGFRGVCAHTPIGCPASDQCHVVGACDPLTGVCPVANKSDGTACNDGNACTVGDSCQSGVCTGGTPLNCNDNNACTTDYCDPATGCNHKPVVCPLIPISVCETQICDPAGGCLIIPVPNGTSCNDGQYCNGNDTCSGGTCVHAGNPCPTGTTCNETTDHCDIVDCTGRPVGTVCNDNNPCTTNDVCIKSGNKMACKGAATVCNDNNPCTTDSCDPTTGSCKFVAVVNGAACNDGNACSVNETCQSGVCTGTPRVCNDNNLCTTDSCDPKSGCKFDPIDCSDGDRCTTDTCNPATGCVHTPKPKSVTILGSNGGETLAVNQQIQTMFTVTGSACIMSSGPDSVKVSPGALVGVNCKVGTGPNPTTGKLDGISMPVDTTTGTVQCPNDSVTVRTIYLDNLKSKGGKDVDTITLQGQDH